MSTISNRCWKHFTRSSLSKNVLITQRKYACQIRAISLKYRHNLFEGGSCLEAAITDHDDGGFPNPRPGTAHSSFWLQLDHFTLVLTRRRSGYLIVKA